MDDFCQAHQLRYTDECPECAALVAERNRVTIPAEEMKRIEDEAKMQADLNMPALSHPAAKQGNFGYMSGYVHGAKAEYLRSLKREKEILESVDIPIKGEKIRAIKCIQCGTPNQFYKNGNSRKNCWFCKEPLNENDVVDLTIGGKNTGVREKQAAKGPMYIQASERLPPFYQRVFFEFRYPGEPIKKMSGELIDYCIGAPALSARGDGTYYISEMGSYIYWLDESCADDDGAERDKAFLWWYINQTDYYRLGDMFYDIKDDPKKLINLDQLHDVFLKTKNK